MNFPPDIIGAIAGDIIGSVYEFSNIVSTDFPLFRPECDFTDDTVMTVAVADALINKRDFAEVLHDYGRHYPGRGYGGLFSRWLNSEHPEPYGSYGNGSAMRVSPVGFYCKSINEVMDTAKNTAVITHNHPEGIKGARAIASAVFMAREKAGKDEIVEFISRRFGYDLNFRLKDVRGSYSFDETCQGSVPQAIAAFYESRDYEDAVRLAVSIGGDSDTIACMAGGVASAFYGHIPGDILEKAFSLLPEEFISIISRFSMLINSD